MALTGYFKLYHANDSYAPALKFYRGAADVPPAEAIVNIATVMQPLLHESWGFIKWEQFNILNQLVDSDTLALPGTWTGEVLNYKYCNCIKISSARVGGVRSIKYLHGVPENAFADGEPVSAWLTSINNLAVSLQVNEFVDTTGQIITKAEFTTVSKRSRVARR